MNALRLVVSITTEYDWLVAVNPYGSCWLPSGQTYMQQDDGSVTWTPLNGPPRTNFSVKDRTNFSVMY